MAIAFATAENTGSRHPFKSGYSERDWYESFMAHQTVFSVCTLQSLSYALVTCLQSKGNFGGLTLS